MLNFIRRIFSSILSIQVYEEGDGTVIFLSLNISSLLCISFASGKQTKNKNFPNEVNYLIASQTIQLCQHFLFFIAYVYLHPKLYPSLK